MSVDTNILKRYAKEGYNVLLSGKHGVGKTAIIKEVFGEVFGEHNESWMYFSSSTIDPWVDFIGIPKNYTTPDGKEVFKIIPPERLTGDEKIEAMFFDEINRADDKTLNALMELIQFKSINGRKFPHLKCIWAAENPANDEDNEYKVTELDPAQKDRFQIQLNIPYELNGKYFSAKYGKETYNISKSWWQKNKSKISPRKLDDMLSGYNKGFSLKDFTQQSSTIDELQFSLSTVSDIKKIKSIIDSNDEAAIKSFFTLDKIRTYEKLLKSNSNLISGFYKFMDDEIKNYITRNIGYREVAQFDMSLLTAEQSNLINSKANSIYFSNNIETINYIKEFPFDMKNTPDVDYTSVFGKIFNITIATRHFNTYQIEKIVSDCGEEKVKEFFKAACFIYTSVDKNALDAKKRTPVYDMINKFIRSSKFKTPTKVKANKVKNFTNKLNSFSLTREDIEGLFE